MTFEKPGGGARMSSRRNRSVTSSMDSYDARSAISKAIERLRSAHWRSRSLRRSALAGSRSEICFRNPEEVYAPRSVCLAPLELGVPFGGTLPGDMANHVCIPNSECQILGPMAGVQLPLDLQTRKTTGDSIATRVTLGGRKLAGSVVLSALTLPTKLPCCERVCLYIQTPEKVLIGMILNTRKGDLGDLPIEDGALRNPRDKIGSVR